MVTYRIGNFVYDIENVHQLVGQLSYPFKSQEVVLSYNLSAFIFVCMRLSVWLYTL